MYFSAGDLLNFEELTLVSGKKGLYRKISCPFVWARKTFDNYMEAEELIFITGAGIEVSEERLNKLVEEGIKLNISGIVFMAGEGFIEKIYESTKALSEKHNFPIFSMSHKTKLVSLTKKIMNAVSMRLNEDIFNKIHLGKILFDENKILNSQMSTIYQLPFKSNSFILIMNKKKGSKIKIEETSIIKVITKKVPIEDFNLINYRHLNEYIYMFSSNDKNVLKLIKKIMVEYFNKFKNDFSMGIGRIIDTDEDNIQESYKDAKNIINFNNNNYTKSKFYDFEDLKSFRLILEIKDPIVINEYFEETIGRLFNNKNKNSEDLIKTLWEYLINNGNKRETSESLYIHRNTLNYRLEQIEEILKKNIDDSLVRYELFSALIIGIITGKIDS
ncbi:hypothetical protein HKO22_08300 [Peptoniphilus sp. AGMB00490]|uniref:Sugar diacid regulator n=1 Tax=Peptoniphilus faecalis TaxID=2731255 RepID=A0A848RIB4_9FIRM|nr:PucR family transcriptional regulator [Peptoniphilus faecalis]NMW85735.1 hypothetical protein [Peptoniphilus faecalis]